MNQCVPSWDLDDPNPPPRPVLDIQLHPNLSPGPIVPMPDVEVAELTWENGNISSHGLGAPRIIKAMPKYPAITTTPSVPTSATGITWAAKQQLAGGGMLEAMPKYPAIKTTTSAPTSATGITWAAKQQLAGGGTLEEVVNEATRSHMLSPVPVPGTNFMPWTNPAHAMPAAVDMLVPCARDEVETAPVMRKRARVVGEDGRVCASQGSAAPGRGESTLVTLDTCGGAGAGDDMGFTTTNNSSSLSPVDGEGGGSPETENASIGGGGVGANDSICQSLRSKRDVVCDEEENLAPKLEIGRASISTKRSRAAAIHNESERKRRDRINQKMKTLQKLVPNSSKTDKASMLDEAIDYLKQLQGQVNMMSRMMMPMAPMPPLQMSMMANMAQMAQMAQLGMSVGPPMVNLGSMSQSAGYSGMLPPPLLHPSTFVPFSTTAWDGSSDRLKQAGGSAMTDPLSAFLACQAAQQSVGMDAYNRIAALYQQLYQQNQHTNSKP